MIIAAPTYHRLEATFDGTEAHAGIQPEAGHSAIEAATAAVARMRLGRLDEETTANVGVIEGGTASNVVAGRCRIDAEARSLDETKASETLGAMVDACTWAATEYGCDLDADVSEIFRGYKLAASSPAVQMAMTALEGLRAQRGSHLNRRRQRCQRPLRGGIRMRPACQRHRREPHP